MSETQKKKPAGTFVKLPDAATKLSTSIQSGERSTK